MHTAKGVLGIAGGRRSFEGGIDDGRRMICTQHCRFLDGLQVSLMAVSLNSVFAEPVSRVCVFYRHIQPHRVLALSG